MLSVTCSVLDDTFPSSTKGLQLTGTCWGVPDSDFRKHLCSFNLSNYWLVMRVVIWLCGEFVLRSSNSNYYYSLLYCYIFMVICIQCRAQTL